MIVGIYYNFQLTLTLFLIFFWNDFNEVRFHVYYVGISFEIFDVSVLYKNRI